MATVLKHGIIPYREKTKYNGRNLRMSVYRGGGYVPLKKNVKLRNDQIQRVVFAESDRLDARIAAALKGGNVCWCLYVTGRSRMTGSNKTFRFVIIRERIFERKENRKKMDEAIAFAREVAKGVGLHEYRAGDGGYVFSRDREPVALADLVTLLDDEAENQSGDDEFLDDDPDGS